MRNKLFCLSVFLLCVISAYSHSSIDSLKNELGKDIADTSRVLIYSQLSKEFWLSDAQKNMYYAQEAYKLAEKIDWVEGKARAMNNLGSAHISRGNYDEALRCYQMGIAYSFSVKSNATVIDNLNNIGVVFLYQGFYDKALRYFEYVYKAAKSANDVELKANALGNMGLVKYYAGDNEKALRYFKKALTLYEENDLKILAARAINNIGAIYEDMGDYYKAIVFYYKSVDYKKELNDRQGVASSLNNIALIYNQFGYYDDALKVFSEALHIEYEMKHRKGIAQVLHNIGSTYKKQEAIDDALYFFQKSYAIEKEIGHRKGESESLNNIGLIYYAKEDYRAALANLHKAMVLKQELGDKQGIMTTNFFMGNAYNKTGRINQALNHYENSLETARELNNIPYVVDNLQALSELYSEAKDFNNAYLNLLSYNRIKDSINNAGLDEKIFDIKEKYESEAQKELIALLEDENLLKESMLQRNTILLFFILSSFLLLVIVIYIFFDIYKTRMMNHDLLFDQEVRMEIMEKEKRFSDIVRLLPQIIFETNKSGVFTFFNGNGLKKTGYTAYDIYLKNINDIVFEKPMSGETLDINERNLLQHNGKEMYIKLFDGTYLPIVLFINKVDIENVFYGYRGIMLDISEQKDVEQKILKAVISTEERQSIQFAKDLHDTLGPILSALKLYVNELNNNTPENERMALLNTINTFIDEAIAHSRELSHSLMPNTLLDYGLIKSVELFITKIAFLKKIEIIFKHKNINVRYNNFFEISIYRITLELIQNSMKHASAQTIVVDFNEQGGFFFFKYYDDGKGFDMGKIESENSMGLGLMSINSRVKAINGNMTIKTSTGEGFSFTLSAPVALQNNTDNS